MRESPTDSSILQFRQLDAFQDIPEELVERYDVIHIQLFVLIVKENDPVPLLQNLLRLLSMPLILYHSGVVLLVLPSSVPRISVKTNEISDSHELFTYLRL